MRHFLAFDRYLRRVDPPVASLVLLPEVPGRQAFGLTALIDTGADRCVAPVEAAQYLGFDLTRAPTYRVSTASGLLTVARRHCRVHVFDQTIMIDVDFTTVDRGSLIGRNAIDAATNVIALTSGGIHTAWPADLFTTWPGLFSFLHDDRLIEAAIRRLREIEGELLSVGHLTPADGATLREVLAHLVAVVDEATIGAGGIVDARAIVAGAIEAHNRVLYVSSGTRDGATFEWALLEIDRRLERIRDRTLRAATRHETHELLDAAANFLH